MKKHVKNLQAWLEAEGQATSVDPELQHLVQVAQLLRDSTHPELSALAKTRHEHLLRQSLRQTHHPPGHSRLYRYWPALAITLLLVLAGVWLFGLRPKVPADNSATRNQATASISEHCWPGLGYWKTQADWPVTEITLGRFTYNQTELRVLLETPVRGDASIILARDYIVARLNGADAEHWQAALDDVLLGYEQRLPLGVGISTAEGRAMQDLANAIREASHLPLCRDE